MLAEALPTLARILTRCRPRYASVNEMDPDDVEGFFEFDDVRTADNIEFEVEGTIFWQVGDVQQLLKVWLQVVLVVHEKH